MQEPRPCRNILCGENVLAGSKNEFCFRCQAELAKMRAELDRLSGVWLPLEAEFVAWCREHGKPHPHE